MQNNMFSKKILWVLVSVAVLAVVAMAGAAIWQKKYQTKNNEVPKNTEGKQTQNVVKTEVEANKTPEAFPIDMPIEAGAKIVQNYNATTADGHIQATRVFETKKTLDENVKIYQAYLKKNGWTLDPVVEVPNYKLVAGTKGDEKIQISMDLNTSTEIKTVSISLTGLNK